MSATAWLLGGALLVLVTLGDALVTVLDADAGGPVVNRLVRGEWVLLRGVTRRLRRARRPAALRQAGSLLMVTAIVWWVCGIIAGFSLIYFGAMLAARDADADYAHALYLGAWPASQLVRGSTGDDDALLVIAVVQAVVAVLVGVLVLAFVSGVAGVGRALRTLSARYFRAGRGIPDPIDVLAPYFPDGRPRRLDPWLGSIIEPLSAYSAGLGRNPLAYYLQSGRDQVSLPFSLYMTAGVVGALRWGMPTASAAATQPALVPLADHLEELQSRLRRMLRVPVPSAPAPVRVEQFAQEVAAFREPGRRRSIDPGVLRFLTVERRAAALVRSSGTIDPDDAHRRYTQWLAFDVEAQTLLAAVSRDLDYQPVYRGLAATAGAGALDRTPGTPLPAAITGPRVPIIPAPGEDPSGSGRRPFGPTAWVRRQLLFIDPGRVRVTDALRSLAAVAVAVVLAAIATNVMSVAATGSATIAAMIALFATPSVAAGATARARLAATAVAVIPVAFAITFGSLLPKDPVAIAVAMAIVAAVAVWLRRFRRLTALAQLGFVTFYFSLLIGLTPGAILSTLACAVAGLAAAWLAQTIPEPTVPRQLDGGIAALYERVGVLVDTMVDLVSTGRTDRRLVRALLAERAALERTVDQISGPIDRLTPAQMSPERARTLRIRVFDVQLAAENLQALLPVVSRTSITPEERARLAADLVAVRLELSTFRDGASGTAPPVRRAPWQPPHGLAPEVRGILFATVELLEAVDGLRLLQLAHDGTGEADSGGPRGAETEGVATDSAATTEGVATDSAATTEATAARSTAHAAPAAEAGGLRPSDRQAVQAGFATGLALFLGSLVSTSHQYWAAMPAFRVISDSDGETRRKAIQRIVATMAGSGIAFGLAIVAGHSALWAFPLLIVSVFFMTLSRSVAPAWMGFWVTLMLATMYDLQGTLDVETVQIRLVETAIGAVVAAVIAAVVLPTRTGTRVVASMGHILDETGALLQDQLAPLVGGVALERDARAERESQLGRLMMQLEELAKPVRRNPGALRADGIEAQLTALWSALYYARRLGRAVTRIHPSMPEAADWGALVQATDENVQAARDVLAGRLPERLHPAEDFAVASEAAARVSLQLTRLNQALLALIDAVAPGTTAATLTSAAPPSTR
ncbi:MULTISPECIES: FUSC family protein [unclassified Microbacterium]|uniref:FUSC family protein n=1 Tax=unclassified Microbacterium TaxID=2609290 RepID=UPI00214BBAF8|nr:MULTISPECIES: FUSC family protein [unclassified Microbacterium]MCR2783711.1 FUSC family protein [Microbacterium sp. zg.B96]WIM15435.1 FUSC family protein [Microbacterium sp. zg-B96]